jgi:cell wall-associated NlpC family hydrolase
MTVLRSRVSRPASNLLVALTLVLGLFGGVATTGAVSAQAAVSAGVSAPLATRALRNAASRNGDPYQWGAVGPYRFDCSGLTKWAYAHAGMGLPRTVAQQYAATIRLARAHVRPGDLVFFMSGGRPYHVGIYAGGGRVWHAPSPGNHVRLAAIWTTAVAYGRVR